MTDKHDGAVMEFFTDANIQDPYPLYDRMRERGPVHQVGNSEFYVVCGLDVINEVINYPEVFSSNLTSTMTYTPEHGIVSPFSWTDSAGRPKCWRPPTTLPHAAHRKLLIPQLAAKRIGAAERFVGDTAERLWREGLAMATSNGWGPWPTGYR